MIKVENLSKNYSGKNVLDNISVEISDGRIFSIMGMSGSGKSTFIKCLARLINPDGGKIFLDGQNILSIKDGVAMAKIRRNFGYLFQEGALFDSLNVMENVCFGLKYLTDIPKSEYARVAKEKLNLVGLKDVEYLKISELSGGMKKRVALARAIAPEPKYIFYDEPTTGLDPLSTRKICELITDTRDKLNVTSIVVTHKVELALSISDEVTILDKGKFAIVGKPSEIKKSKISAVKEFISEPACLESDV